MPNMMRPRTRVTRRKGAESVCGRIARERQDLAEQLGFAEIAHLRLPIRFNLAPTQRDVFIHQTADGYRAAGSRWGLIPRWAKERGVGNRMFNARVETLLERPAFRTLVRANRCIVPVSGFYEWQQVGRQKVPMFIRRTDDGPMVLAGLWTIWHDPEPDQDVTSHTIITTSSNRFMATMHNRMPVILHDRATWERWLDPANTDLVTVLSLAAPCPDDLLTAYSVSTLVNNTRNDGPELLAPAE